MTGSPGHPKQTVSEKLQTAVTIELTVPDIKATHERAGAKWSAYEGDVLRAPIAEMDFPLAPPVDAERDLRPTPLRGADDGHRLVRVGRRRRSAHPVDHTEDAAVPSCRVQEDREDVVEL